MFSDYMGFMKKATTLLKNYMLIKKVELEVEQLNAVYKTETTNEISKEVSPDGRTDGQTLNHTL